jgi:triacylglycerol lipase
MSPSLSKESFTESARNIVPPIPAANHPYFAQDCAKRPTFDNLATDLSWANAWWLAEASLAAYHATTEAEQIFAVGGFDARLFAKGAQAQAYVIHDVDKIIVAFRDAELKAINFQLSFDWSANLHSGFTEYDGVRGRVHESYGESAIYLLGNMHHHLRSLQSQKLRPIWLTGHGQGGALATISGFLHQNVKGVYTFGAPKAGDGVFATNYPVPHFRFCYHGDPVPRALPGATAFRHAGTSIYFADEARFEFDNEPDSFVAPNPIHNAPIAYAALAWNFA